MPAVDTAQLVRSAIETNKEIPAVLDAYGEFVDGPIGPLELQNLGEVFARILDNLSQRFPDAASKRAAKTAQNDVGVFLRATNDDVEVLKQVMKNELISIRNVMAASIAERFRRMDGEERQAIDATLRLIRRSSVELLFKSPHGKPLSTADKEFQRFFATIKSQAREVRELRYQNLIVEKAIFNKLILKSSVEDQDIWVPSFYAKESVSQLISKTGVTSDHPILAALDAIERSGGFQRIESFLEDLETSQGLLTRDAVIPEEISGLFVQVAEFKILPPIDLDDVTEFLNRKRAKESELVAREEEKQRTEAEAVRLEQESKARELRQKSRPKEISVPREEVRATSINSVYLGKELDFDQLVSSLSKRLPEKEIEAQVKQTGDYFLELSNDISIVGSSGSGKSVTLKRILDGIAQKPSSRRIFVIDQKGEHRGIAWKYKWPVYGFVKDSQANELKIPFLTSKGDNRDDNLAADLIQEWVLQNGANCSDEEKERIASIISSNKDARLGLAQISDALLAEKELSPLGQRVKKNLVLKSSFGKIFSETSTVSDMPQDGSVLFDISGRGLRDPTTKEERQMLTVLLLRELLIKGVSGSVIIVEDELDRFKVNSLKSRTVAIAQKLRENGNSLIITSRSQGRDFLGADPVELLHRLSGEKVISDEFSGFVSDASKQTLARVISFLPRGWLITSRIKVGNVTNRTTAVQVDQLQFESGRT
jgi:energy-coupling factor transporter ATP-binding protein EcfA2